MSDASAKQARNQDWHLPSLLFPVRLVVAYLSVVLIAGLAFLVGAAIYSYPREALIGSLVFIAGMISGSIVTQLKRRGYRLTFDRVSHMFSQQHG